jgi:pilus assembly protein Flp/PilA
MQVIHLAKSSWTEEDGVTAVEYGFIVALIAVAIIIGAATLGTSLNGFFTRLADCMATPTVAVCGRVA